MDVEIVYSQNGKTLEECLLEILEMKSKKEI